MQKVELTSTMGKIWLSKIGKKSTEKEIFHNFVPWLVVHVIGLLADDKMNWRKVIKVDDEKLWQRPIVE